MDQHGCAEDKELCRIAYNDIYVDDCITSVPDIATADRMVKGLTDTISKGGFRM